MLWLIYKLYSFKLTIELLQPMYLDKQSKEQYIYYILSTYFALYAAFTKVTLISIYPCSRFDDHTVMQTDSAYKIQELYFSQKNKLKKQHTTYVCQLQVLFYLRRC